MSKQSRFSSLPTATGGIARAAYAHAIAAGLNVEPLLLKCDFTVPQAENADLRMAVQTQIKFLNLVADAMGDDFLGVRLAQSLDLRELGLLYYVLASSEKLGEALRRVARYSMIHNEGVKIIYSERKHIRLRLEIYWRWANGRPASGRIRCDIPASDMPAAHGQSTVPQQGRFRAPSR